MSENKKAKGKLVFMPDIEYTSWLNRNGELIDEIIKTGKVNTMWLRKGQNKEFLVRALHERGYSISFD